MSLAQIIAARRTAFRLSEDDVAELADLPVKTVISVEKGVHRPTAFELTRIADALAVDPASLWRGEAASDDPQRGTARFLAGPSLRGLTARDQRLLARAAEVGRIGAGLWKLLKKTDTPLLTRRTVTPLSSHEEPWEQGYKLGQAARLAIEPNRQPLASVQALLESQGVHVASVNFEVDDVIAASLAEPNALPVVLLNRRHARVQLDFTRRSTLAHELCHILHDATAQNVVSMVSRRTQELEPLEQRANGFGPSFLAPGSWVQVQNGSSRQVVTQLATEWALSWEGACWHAKNLGLITPQDAEALRDDAPRSWKPSMLEESVMRTPTGMFGLESEASPLVSGLISELVIQAFAEGEISRGRAEEILLLR